MIDLYLQQVVAPEGLSVTVIPGELRFDEVNQKASFTVTVEGAPGPGVWDTRVSRGCQKSTSCVVRFPSRSSSDMATLVRIQSRFFFALMFFVGKLVI
jgi:hypothetical protein